MVTNHHRQLLQERVQRGIALLDEKRPDWRKKINLAILDLSSGCDCVLGQVYGHYTTGSNRVGLVQTDEDQDYEMEEAQALIEHGFYAPSYEYSDLTAAWKQALEEATN